MHDDLATATTVTIVSPAYREQVNLPIMHARLIAALDPAIDWEWIIVDDHSPDETFSVAEAIARSDARVRAVRFSRNFGSHIAIACGLDLACSRCAVVMASDLQDPPEMIPELVEHWQKGSQIVWAVRSRRDGEGATKIGFAKFYYWIMRNIVGLETMPPTGADFFLLDGIVVSAARQIKERNASLFALLTWMGFRTSTIYYDKQARIHGATGWTLRKKVRLVADSVISFSNKPIRWLAVFGMSAGALGFLYAGFVIYNASLGTPVEGWSSLMVVVLIIGGTQMAMLGLLGEYLWRALDETRQRPKYLIEAATGQLPDGVESVARLAYLANAKPTIPPSSRLS